MKKIVLIDLDGTIGDTKYGVIEAVKYALNKINFRALNDAELNEFIGPPIFEALINAGVDIELASDAVDEYRYAYSQPAIEVNQENINYIYEKVVKNGAKIHDLVPGYIFSKPFDGIIEMMQKLSDLANKKEWTIITGTSKPELWARIIIDNFGINQYFTCINHVNQLQSGKIEDLASKNAHTYLEYEGANELKLVNQNECDGIFGASMDKSRTSKQAVLEYALQAAKYNEKFDRAILIGDRKHDIIGAHNIQIPVIGCKWGYALENELDPAEYLATKPFEVLQILEEYFS